MGVAGPRGIAPDRQRQRRPPEDLGLDADAVFGGTLGERSNAGASHLDRHGDMGGAEFDQVVERSDIVAIEQLPDAERPAIEQG